MTKTKLAAVVNEIVEEQDELEKLLPLPKPKRKRRKPTEDEIIRGLIGAVKRGDEA
jgi:hypothetical protein